MKARSVLLSLAGFAMVLAASAATADQTAPITVPNCEYFGQRITVDLSTTPTVGAVDPSWRVSGPTGFLAPGHTTLSAWTALPNNWVQPSAPTVTAVHEPPGDYTYSLQIFLPCDPTNYRVVDLSGNIAADNEILSVSANGNPSVASCGGTCFNTPPGGTPFGIPIAQLHSGLNTLQVVVHNEGSYSGISVVAHLTLVCGRYCCRTLPIKKFYPQDPR
ncbi:MAG TPA: hypothetical protein VIM02_09530 [Rhizomicrobium sp.]|jgi:hypothetical protein